MFANSECLISETAHGWRSKRPQFVFSEVLNGFFDQLFRRSVEGVPIRINQ